MGTNYYVKGIPEWSSSEKPHIGKQSAGWPWHWADVPWTIAEQWTLYAQGHPELRVEDEYGNDCGLLLDFVSHTTRQTSDYHSSGDFS